MTVRLLARELMLHALTLRTGSKAKPNLSHGSRALNDAVVWVRGNKSEISFLQTDER